MVYQRVQRAATPAPVPPRWRGMILVSMERPLERTSQYRGDLRQTALPEMLAIIHQARVAMRRLRSAIKLFAPVLPVDFVAAYGQTWQTLAGALGDTRNWDVFVAETLPPILAAFPGHRDARKVPQRRRIPRRRCTIGQTSGAGVANTRWLYFGRHCFQRVSVHAVAV